jgi:HK97 gp10 family phage protein
VADDVYIVFDEAALDELFSSVDGPAGKFLKRCTTKVTRRAKQLAPVDTGRLRSSIADEIGHEGTDLVGRIGTDVEYAVYQEFGTVHMAAHPYLRPALDAAKGTT